MKLYPGIPGTWYIVVGHDACIRNVGISFPVLCFLPNFIPVKVKVPKGRPRVGVGLGLSFFRGVFPTNIS